MASEIPVLLSAWCQLDHDEGASGPMIFPVTSWHAPFSAFMICAIGACPSSWRRSLAADGDEDSRPQPDRLTVNTYTHLLPEIEREAIDCEGDLRVTDRAVALAACRLGCILGCTLPVLGRTCCYPDRA